MLLYQVFLGAGFHGLFSFVELGEAILAGLDFCGDGEALLERSGCRRCGSARRRFWRGGFRCGDWRMCRWRSRQFGGRASWLAEHLRIVVEVDGTCGNLLNKLGKVDLFRGVGSKSDRLLASDDADENPYELNFAGTGISARDF